MTVTAVHVLLYTAEAEQLRALLGDAFGWPHVDAGGGWPIYALPPAELAVHPADGPRHELSLMCDDLPVTMAELRARGVDFHGEPEEHTWGTAVTMRLPGDVEMLLYQPRHPTAHAR
jgi:catechol 2,3-dioxygenase-like lactoylglutathione lyase family enzyme